MRSSIKTLCIAGKNEIAVFALDSLRQRYPKARVICVKNNNDFGYDTWQPSLRKFAKKNNIPILTLQECYEIEDLIFISLEFDKIIKPHLFSSDQLFNIHFSKLPAYKGMYTSSLPLLFGEVESGVTLHRIDQGIDTGEIIDQTVFPISDIKSARELYFAYLQQSKKLFEKNIDALMTRSFNSSPQSAIGSSYYSTSFINFEDLKINLKETALQVINQIRAFNFREYQLPVVLGYHIHSAEITTNISTVKEASIVSDDLEKIIVSTIDYDVILRKDKISRLYRLCELDEADQAKKIVADISTLNIHNSKGWTPLIVASYNGSSELISILLKNGASVNSPNYKGTTPLMYAMSHYEKTGNSLPFDILMQHGADPEQSDLNGKTLRDYMVERNVKGFF